MYSFSVQTLFPLLPLFLSQVNAHGYIAQPKARQPGQVFGSICGSQTLNNQQADIFGNIQGELQVARQEYDPSKCNLWLCKGFQFADQDASSVQSYTAGQVVPIEFDIHAPHDGVANISIVDTGSNSVISELKSWDQYALTSRPAVAAERNFDITIPSDLGGKCTTAGECVIQMFWDARSVDQTYESCIDFTVGGGSGNGGEGGVPSSSAAPVMTTSASSRVSSAVASASSASVVITNSASSDTKVVETTTPVASMSVTSAAGASATGDVFTMTAGTMTMACREEL